MENRQKSPYFRESIPRNIANLRCKNTLVNLQYYVRFFTPDFPCKNPPSIPSEIRIFDHAIDRSVFQFFAHHPGKNVPMGD